jgi:putative nucleotidyltransferase with HDIG domain
VGPEAEAQIGRSVAATDLSDGASLGEHAAGGARPPVVLAALTAETGRLGVVAVTSAPPELALSEADRRMVATLAAHAALAMTTARLHEQQRRSDERQRLSEQISRHLQRTLDSEVLIPLILREVSDAIDAEAQSLWLLDRGTGLLVCQYATGSEPEAIKKIGVPVGAGIVGSCVERQTAILVADAQQDERFFRAADRQTGFVTRSLLCVPLVRQGKAIGAIEAANKRSGGAFTPDDLALMRNIADSAALAVENAQLYADLSKSYDSTLAALMSALDSRDRDTEGHSRRVQEYTARLARELGLDDAAIATIRRGALIHDIGKISVPDAILKKPGPLEPEERRIMQKHALRGYEMLFGIPHLEAELAIVLAHHERWDGKGYPFGLAGEAIPLAARLFAVSDTFDAVTSDRPYRPGRSCAAALRVIADERGRQFDPRAVDAFLAIPPGQWEVIRSGVVAELADRRASRDEEVRRSHLKLGAGSIQEIPTDRA